MGSRLTRSVDQSSEHSFSKGEEREVGQYHAIKASRISPGDFMPMYSFKYGNSGTTTHRAVLPPNQISFRKQIVCNSGQYRAHSYTGA